MKSRLEEIDVVAMLSLIEQEANDLQTNEMLQDEIALLEKTEFSSDVDLERAKASFKEKLTQFKKLLNMKQAMFMELILSVESLIAMNDQYVRNEAEKMQIQA